MRAKSRDYLVDLKIGRRMDYLYISVQNEICEDADRESLLKMNTVKDDADVYKRQLYGSDDDNFRSKW